MGTICAKTDPYEDFTKTIKIGKRKFEFISMIF